MLHLTIEDMLLVKGLSTIAGIEAFPVSFYVFDEKKVDAINENVKILSDPCTHC